MQKLNIWKLAAYGSCSQ